MSRAFQYRIEPAESGQRLDKFLATRFGSLSRMRIANLIEAGSCQVNGVVARAGYRLAANDYVEVAPGDGPPTAMTPESFPLEIISEDDHILVVVKPAGMLVHPTMSVKSGTLANALAYHLNESRIENGGWRIENRANESTEPQLSIADSQPAIRPGIVHRLDRATSGLIVIAKTPRALTVLSNHFRKRLAEKRYLALVHGVVLEDVGSIVAPIGRDPDQRPHWRVTRNGRPAETRFNVLERFERATLLELAPVTGRTNQLRIHCAHIGHPIVGDELHRNPELRIANCESRASDVVPSDQQSGSEHRRFASRDAQFAIRDSQFEIRLCLHAWKLAFHHPATGEWLAFTSDLPDEMSEVVNLYRRR